LEGPALGRTDAHRESSLLLATAAIAAVGVTHLIDFGVYHLRYRILNADFTVGNSMFRRRHPLAR